MSESHQKPKPRPRPRPRNAASQETDTPGPSSKSPIEVEDSLFIRNKNRSANSWSKINNAVDKREARQRSVDPDSSDSDSPRAKKARRQPFEPRPKEMPAWAKSEGLIEIQDSDSEGESNASILDIDSHITKSSPDALPTRIQRRQRSRSRSESPEPEVYIAEQMGRERARMILASRKIGSRSPIIVSDKEDDELDNMKELPAELAAIKAEARRKLDRVISAENRSASTATVELRITLRPHPEDASAKSLNFSHTMNRNEKFEQLFHEVADAGDIPVNRLVVLFNNHRVYPFSTPQTFSIWSEADLVAYEEHVYQYVKSQLQSPPPVKDASVAPTDNRPGTTSVHEYNGERDVAQDKADTFKLHVRSGETTITVAVRNTTKCSAIVSNVLKKLGKPASAEKKARIEVDGEKLGPNSEIGEVELEDGDLVDIVGV
ncbi:uncharacterized protein FOMMEDRAFT_137384 [Fomitiporia mediterranea MF3/22]|uniref:uncharacterized protein n=1 Tax=Fomitiporia mediterranea (strain MF3/22) TaxID=694068 RepID=UPI0004408F30|nr:uncharacterized protein FOMMEDRAFT_137384 [Fomitiporia mediterranea MF3/22]EJC98048.1 hypothetical protein FOMMEDRAFT_137384 [Fomitiporia mediterranea MF3/22]